VPSAANAMVDAAASASRSVMVAAFVMADRR
jgi:hypothetical protein